MWGEARRLRHDEQRRPDRESEERGGTGRGRRDVVGEVVDAEEPPWFPPAMERVSCGSLGNPKRLMISG
jgi:hypothetical protein